MRSAHCLSSRGTTEKKGVNEHAAAVQHNARARAHSPVMNESVALGLAVQEPGERHTATEMLKRGA
jgi:hypothetical protein